MLNVCIEDVASKFIEVVDTVKSGEDVPACVMSMVCVTTPVPLTVIIAFRSDVLVLVAIEIVTVPLFAPVAGATVSHDGALLLTVQLVFDVMVNVSCLARDETCIFIVDSVKE